MCRKPAFSMSFANPLQRHSAPASENASLTAASAPSISAGESTPSLPVNAAAAVANATRSAQITPITIGHPSPKELYVQARNNMTIDK